MDTIIQSWLNTFISMETVRAYRSDMNKFKTWMTNEQLLFEDLQLINLQHFQQSLTSSSADRRLISSVKSFFKHCFNQGHIQTPIARCLVTPRRQQIRRERKLTKEQVMQMITLAKGTDILLLKVLFYLGLRLSEARCLKRDDIRQIDGCLHFNVVGKGNKRRTVHLSRNVSRSILPMLPKNGYIFRGNKGSCLSRTQAYRRVKDILRQVVPESSPHWLRHSYCSLSIASGASLVSVSKSMGHSSVETTSTYCHSHGPSVSSFLE